MLTAGIFRGSWIGMVVSHSLNNSTGQLEQGTAVERDYICIYIQTIYAYIHIYVYTYSMSIYIHIYICICMYI